jgi:hypothetical protein
MTWGLNCDDWLNNDHICACILHILIRLHANFIRKRQRRDVLYFACGVLLNGLILCVRIVYGDTWEVIYILKYWIMLAALAAFLLLACVTTR